MKSLEIQFWESLCGRYLKPCDWISKRWKSVSCKERKGNSLILCTGKFVGEWELEEPFV